MDWVLFALTVVSLTAAAAFAIVTWRLLREESKLPSERALPEKTSTTASA